MRAALERTLSQFGVDAAVSRITRGPTVTRFELTLGPGVKVSAVTKLNDDISYALATPEIRIVAPIPGKSAIGIEVPNREKDTITLGDVLRSPEALAAAHPLMAAIGVDIAGKPVLMNLGRMPHVLIAGATGSGKSVTMNAIVTSLVMRTKPSEVKLILVDPKRVELSTYEGVPHLLTSVVTDPKRAKEALDWTVDEMNQRYQRLQLLGYRNLDQYNDAVRAGTVRQASALSGEADTSWEPLPYIVFVIDELADLMMVAPRDVEGGIVRIAQMARAVGIHLVIATQRPSVDVVTGLIKANVPARIALSMATGHDSKTILDQYGAEKLVGNGDMLYLPANVSKPHRVQGCFVSESEIEAAIEHCKAQSETDYVSGVVREGKEAVVADVQGDDASDDDLIRAARDLVIRSGLGSTSMLQRKLRIGFSRAGRVMDELEQLGVVGPSEGSKARTVLMTVADLEGSAEE
jgi:S-DNA-T family DNA segregation ATPase FtsK/SpoIIIE